MTVQSNMFQEVTFGTKKKWSFKTGDCLIEVVVEASVTVNDNFREVTLSILTMSNQSFDTVANIK